VYLYAGAVFGVAVAAFAVAAAAVGYDYAKIKKV